MCDIEEQPETFGLKVASDPMLKISNKIHNPVEQKLDFSDALIQTRNFDKDAETYNNNFKAVDKLLRVCGEYSYLNEYNKKLGKKNSTSNSLVWENVNGRYIKEFLSDYKTSSKAQKIKSYNMAKYVEEQLKVGGLINWTVCLINVKSEKGYTIDDLAGLPPIGGGIKRGNNEENNCYEVEKNIISLKSLKSKDQEFLDCHQKIINEVKEEAKLKKENGEILGESYLRKECRKRNEGRKRALLVLYPIDYRNEDCATNIFNIPGIEHKTPFGFMIVFPDREGQGEAISYTLNPVAAGGYLSELFE